MPMGIDADAMSYERVSEFATSIIGALFISVRYSTANVARNAPSSPPAYTTLSSTSALQVKWVATSLQA